MGLLVMATTAVIGPPHVLMLELIKKLRMVQRIISPTYSFFPGEKQFPAAAVTDQEVNCWPLVLCTQTYNSVGASSEWG